MRNLFPKTLMQQLGLWAMGQALPDPQELRKHSQNALIAVVFAIIGAMLVGAVIIGGLYALYGWLVLEGLSVSASLGVTCLLALLLSALCMLAGWRYVDRLSAVKDDLQLFEKQDPVAHTANLLQEIASSFLEGFKQEPNISDEIAIATRRAEEKLAALEKELEEALREAEITPPRNNDGLVGKSAPAIH